jgi:NADP-dependent 3-hydroxy acid dehydrogenase YdfG
MRCGLLRRAGDPDDWDLQTHINLQAPMRLTRFLVPGMKEAGEGHIINVASIEALYPYPSVRISPPCLASRMPRSCCMLTV